MRPGIAIVVLCAAIAMPAFGQAGPSFDCAKASNAVERIVCKDPELAKADRDMASTYGGLADKLGAAAREYLLADQLRWIGDRNRACPGDADGIASCLKERYAARTANLQAFAEGPFPFIGEQSLYQRGRLGKIAWSYDIVYPRFDGASADFASVNARFAGAAKSAAETAVPKADAGPEREQRWTYEQSFRIYRPGANAVTVAVSFYGYSGGAHGYGATDCTLVDLRTGRAVGPQGVFAAGEQWLRVMTQTVSADLKRQFVEKPGFDDALEPANLAKLLSEPGHYCWRAAKLELIFNAYEVGPYVSGPFKVDVPYGQLKPLLRADGPVGR